MRIFAQQRSWMAAILALMLLTAVSVPLSAPASADEQDSYTAVRNKLVATIVGNGDLDLADPDVAAKVASVTQLAQDKLSRLDRSDSRTSVFSDLKTPSPNQNITQTYLALRDIAVAYRTVGTPLHNDPAVRADIISALVWLEKNWYNADVPFAPQSPDNNWFAWELGVPLALVDVLALMYDDLPEGLLPEYLAAIDHFLPRPDRLGHSVNWNLASEGANLAWAVTVLGKRGILGQDGAIVTNATQALSPLFDYAADGANGFNRDGSVLFHEGFPYTTGYGWSNIIEPTLAVMLYEGSPWAIKDPDKGNLVNWVKDSFEPFLFGNRIHDSLAGRNIARPRGQDRATGLINLALDLRSIGTQEESEHLASLVKYLLVSDPQSSFWRSGSIPNIVEARRILNDSGIPALKPTDSYGQFPAMDRAVARRDGWSFGVAMHSSRTQNYESINNENVRGWHTADGRTTLLTSDVDQYGNDYWPTIDSARIPGTTVVKHLDDDVIAPQLGRVEIVGPQTIVDELDDLSHVHYRSPRWIIEKDPKGANGDPSRVRRTENSQEQLTYAAPSGASSFALEVHHTAASGLDRLVVMVSSNDSSYSAVKVTATPTVTADGWTTSVVRPSGALPAGTRFVRIQLLPSVPQAHGDSAWAGGADLNGKYGVSGMQIASPGTTLDAQKSWFVMDDEVVAVGSGITANKGREVETIVENRRLSDAFPGRLTVDGQELGADDGKRDLGDVSWAALSGGVSGSDLGYVFPKKTALTALHESRSANWSEIGNSNLAAQNRFASLAINHGKDPQDASYSYVLLPGADAQKTASYAKAPQAEVLSQTTEVHAVREAAKGLLGATVWTDKPTPIDVDGSRFLTVTGRAALMTQETKDGLTIAVSDPTQGADRAGSIDDPANGFSQIFQKSDHWGLEPGGGFKRMAPTNEFLTYKVDQAENFQVTLRWNHQQAGNNTSSILDRVRFSTSPDNATWSPVQAKFTEPYTPIDGGGLDNTADVTNAGALPAGSQYVRIEVLDNDPKIWSPQIRHVQIKSGSPEGAHVDVEVARSVAAVLDKDPRVEVLSMDPVRLRIDVANAKGSTIHTRFAYDTQAPELSVEAPGAVWDDVDSSMTVSAHDDSGAYSLKVTADGQSVPVPTNGVIPLSSEFGVHEYVVTATDKAGNSTEKIVRYSALQFAEDPPMKDTVQQGSTLPVRFHVKAPEGQPQIDATLRVGSGAGTVQFEKSGQSYQALWPTADMPPGKHTLGIAITADGALLPPREREVTIRGK
ncbi:polysaccharide lyase family 8-like protein [Arthrobacter sp. AG258]|uniref:polysaccharide lyase 8 family protein n=1 Tax=Arthrobacter sp. AG258 TaxID=2183899 RepID=UPI0010D335C9|nr:polysaccharide lyase 8 family protein [Arthrobacter sp. AG258]TDT74678.1 polysaccharide lyase family 8-like protein [Arthrobacter sp. AG258]